MDTNQNHLPEDLDGIKCAIIEKNCTPARVNFLKPLLEFNQYTVVVVKSPPPKAIPETFTVAVTDVAFNATNAIFGRLLHTPDGRVVTLAYWLQKEAMSEDEKNIALLDEAIRQQLRFSKLKFYFLIATLIAFVAVFIFYVFQAH